MMNLYSGTTCPFSQRCRIVLYEKGMDFQIIDVDMYNKPEDIAVMNPVQPAAGAGRARPHPLRGEHHQRVHRRALSAPAADAGRPGDARAGAAVPVQLRGRALQPDRHARARQPEAAGEGAPARGRPAHRARAGVHQAEVHAGRRVLDARRGDLAAAVAARLLRHHAAEVGGTADEVRRAPVLRGRRSSRR